MATFYIGHDYHQVELYVIEHRNKSCRDVTDNSSDEEDDDEIHPLVNADSNDPTTVNT